MYKKILSLSLIIFLGLSFIACSKKSQIARKAEHPINSLFLKRESKYDLHRTLSNKEMAQHLKSLFEAARWAPSCYNNQPWRYIYGLYGTPQWDKLYNLLVPFNQKWVSNAGALILVISKNTFEKSGEPARTHSFDTGLSTAQLLLQAADIGLIGHGMSGFDYDMAAKTFNLSGDYTVEAMIAIGESASKEHSTEEFAKRDKKPTTRKPIEDITFEDIFPQETNK